MQLQADKHKSIEYTETFSQVIYSLLLHTNGGQIYFKMYCLINLFSLGRELSVRQYNSDDTVLLTPFPHTTNPQLIMR